MNGPHIVYAWAFGALLALCDGLVYAELGAALPGSGGPYVYLREAYQPFGLGRLMAFIFIFQLMLVAPLSVAGGAVGFADYLGFYWTTMTPLAHNLVAAGVCVAVTALLYRDIRSVGRLAVVMLVVVLATVGWVIVAGLFSFSWAQAFDFPPEARHLDSSLLRAMGAAGLLAMYNYGGYSNVCNIGEELRSPERTLPRSIVLSIVIVVVLYVVMSTVILGMIPWREAQQTRTIASHFIELGSGARPDRGDGDDVADPVRHRLVAVRGDSRLLSDPVRRGARRPVLPRLRPAARDEALSARLAADDRRRDAAVLLLLTRPAGELADPGANPAAVHLAMRGRDPPAPLPPRHRQAVPHVALPTAGAGLDGDVDLHLPLRPSRRHRLLGGVPRRRGRRLRALRETQCEFLILNS
jgi:hypothetical protein